MAYPDSSPVVVPEFEDITVAIRKERTRLQDIEFDTGETPSDSWLQYLESEKARGIDRIVTNF